MINPETEKEFTEKELLEIIMEDLGKLSAIIYPQEDWDGLDIYNRIKGVESRVFETIDILLSIKKLMIIVALFLFIVILLLIF
ncbi:MAG TPA: hypothetical protein PLD14_01715 [Candidatus Pacearchaeota archaeon]|nr:hypothetical protein [Candidatus Pacearchaeota archaeon]HPR79916.1 hypothetical protein [Candidatus Pacearchaeota archaeon]